MSELNESLIQFSALSQETRLLAFRALMAAGTDGLNAGTIAEILSVAPNSLSNHLNILTQSGLVTVERAGRLMIYRANVPAVTELVSFLVENCCHGNPEVCAPLANLSDFSC